MKGLWKRFFLTDVGPGLYTRVILEFKHDNVNMREVGRGGGDMHPSEDRS